MIEATERRSEQALGPSTGLRTLILLTWNGLAYTQAMLASLRQVTPAGTYRLIVVDNGSTDGTREYLQGLDDVQVILNDRNLGYVAGNNQGLAAAAADEDVVLLNNDLLFDDSAWLDRLAQTAYASDDIGLVGCRLKDQIGRLQHVGAYMPVDTLWGQQIGGLDRDIGQYPGVRDAEIVVFACVYIKRSTLDRVGTLDPAFFSYFEDADYCYRVRQAGLRVVVNGDVTLTHHQNVSTKVNAVRFEDMFLKSRATFRSKWHAELSRRYTGEIAWHSLVNFPSGYAVSSRNLVRCLDEAGTRVSYRYVYGKGTVFPIDEPDQSEDYRTQMIRNRPIRDGHGVQVVYAQGDVFQRNTGAYKVGYTMLEVDGLPAEWVRQANTMDELWVPSTFNVETFRNSGVTRPIHVIPLGVDPDFFHPGISPARMSDRYTFLSIFEWGERKAPETLLRAYCRAFGPDDDVLLVCKVINNDGDVHVREQIESMGLPARRPPILLLHNQKLPGYQMGCLYRGADCFVLPTRGEGWGMPILEAMACGLPVIATDWSAQRDFMTADLAYPLAIRKTIPAVAKCPYYDGFRWADPDEDHLVDLMRVVYSDREAAKTKGLHASQVVRQRWTWRAAGARIRERLDAIGAGHA